MNQEMPSRTNRPLPARQTSLPNNRILPMGGGAWLISIPKYLWFFLVIITSPFRAMVWIMNAIISVAVVATIVLVIATLTGHISDDVLASTVSEIGKRGLGILMKSGLLH
jgi:hypothetical protein